MSILSAPKNGHSLNSISSSGNSAEHYKIVETAKTASLHRLESIIWKYSMFIYLFSSTDISEFEDRVEEIRDAVIKGHAALSKEDLKNLSQVIIKLDLFRLQAIVRLLAPLLESKFYSQDAALMIRILLKHAEAEVRYAALESISFALGEVPIAEELLAEAKNLLKNEESTFVREYLESL
ncbi:hypothetical protein ACN23B_18280 [Anabaena sp. FACHB-709]|uniref:HEAT repeat domain-containing protein n=2 Tax=Nostocaceae TaxID=1162 RepID=A0A1Z4KJZ2_ANAVA|nr:MULTISPECIES: hypothetical protein [Nostocaceae]BAY69267.1 hypothetical protein NIES23_20610 [Trichormus variabilis NIES-23]HBW30778.1 hypothetical protein [Nostoc sp. UBA8866]MBD2174709.1 hypothetical protein [Anabaena cylindrica FACHB-318]MBD2266470.1 hypothetical protein [Anabaena sp. FACHB-709]MBD2275882.1 hypothetical protein [Nostoc sp. PCC 7120 = FACHB-418]